MDVIQLQISYYSNEEGDEWLAVSDTEPRFALQDRSEKDLEQKVTRALVFYATIKDGVDKKAEKRPASFAEWQQSETLSIANFLTKGRKTASVDTSRSVVIDVVA